VAVVAAVGSSGAGVDCGPAAGIQGKLHAERMALAIRIRMNDFQVIFPPFASIIFLSTHSIPK
jgi:hypothetical protein